MVASKETTMQGLPPFDHGFEGVICPLIEFMSAFEDLTGYNRSFHTQGATKDLVESQRFSLKNETE